MSLPYPEVPYRRPTSSEITMALGRPPAGLAYYDWLKALKLCQNWASQQPYPVSDWYQRWSMMGYCYGGGGWTWAVGAQPNRTGEWFWEGYFAFFPDSCLIEWAKFKAYLIKNPQPPESGYDAFIAKIETWMFPEQPPPACRVDADCPTGYECIEGVCVPIILPPQCTRDTDCPTGYVCTEGVCVAEPPPVEKTTGAWILGAGAAILAGLALWRSRRRK